MDMMRVETCVSRPAARARGMALIVGDPTRGGSPEPAAALLVERPVRAASHGATADPVAFRAERKRSSRVPTY
jgi:hypothetical protein